MDDSERISILRGRLLKRKVERDPDFLRGDRVVIARSLRESEGASSWQVRRGLLARDRLAAAQFDFDPLELLTGRLAPPPPGMTEAEIAEATEYLGQFPTLYGQGGHCELDMAPVMRGGIDSVIAAIRERLDNPKDEDAAEAYKSFLYALEGLQTMILHVAEGASPEIAASCRRIAHGPPQSFRDAIQLLWLVLLGVMHGSETGLIVPGHLDRVLGPFYEADMERGTLTRGEALLLIESLYLLVNDHTPDGLAISAMVGGRDATGKDVTNGVSYLCLEALRRTHLIYPTVGVCWHEGSPQDLIGLALDIIAEGNPNPAFFGDETIQRGLKSLGVPQSEACYYINSTCVEITPSTASNVWVASPYYPTCRVLLDEIANEAVRSEGAVSFEVFLERYFERLGRWVADGAKAENEARRHRRKYGRKPLQSVFTRDCIARGRDLEDGGAVYNWVECSFVGLANLADSLHVIREEVFNQKRLSFAELKAVLDADFEGHEPVRRRFMERYPKYGHNCPEVDALFAQAVARVQKECAKHKMEPDNSPNVPGAFCWIMHEILGNDCGATPDGRKAGVPFADGCGPAQGREALGPTAAILSTTSWEHSPMIGGLAYNMKFNSSLFESPEGAECLRGLVLTYLKRGGFETQINVVDAETLKRAREHPEAHRDLIVRIGGYTDYFTRLSPGMQDEIIMRTEFAQV